MPQFGAYLTIVIYDCKTFIVQAAENVGLEQKQQRRTYFVTTVNYDLKMAMTLALQLFVPFSMTEK
jgi:hypothetical protein